MRRLFSRVGIRSTRQVDAFVNAERERRLNILHLSKDGDLFYFLTHSLTHSPPTPYTLPSRALFGGRGGRQPRELFPTPFPTFFIHPYVSPIYPNSAFTAFKLNTWDMLIERSLTQIYALREVLFWRFNRVSKPFVRIVFTFKTVSTGVMV